jgi:hypothetical protein
LFLVHHIDSLIQILVGISITWLAFRRPNRLGVRTAKLFRYLGPALIVIGGVLLAEPAARPVGQRKFTPTRSPRRSSRVNPHARS